MSAAQSGSASQRLQKELMELMMSGAEGISAFPENENLFQWIATVQGVPNTAYEGLEFQLTMKFSQNYPFEAPTVTFTTPCFHPNVDHYGAICIDILKENWSAVYTATQVLLSIQNLLDCPNTASPMNAQAAAMWKDRAEYRRLVLVTYGSKKPSSIISS